jgi:hypothetical protein
MKKKLVSAIPVGLNVKYEMAAIAYNTGVFIL